VVTINLAGSVVSGALGARPELGPLPDPGTSQTEQERAA
jgi:hypothetical protein